MHLTVNTDHSTKRWKPQSWPDQDESVFLFHNVMGSVAYFGDQVQVSWIPHLAHIRRPII